MTVRSTFLTVDGPDETTRLATQIGTRLKTGDVLLLSGGIGAGKSHFARSLIQSLQNTLEDVPSPTFTLVQEYETRLGPLWHADLYRLSNPDEVEELGLLDAMLDAICLIEWPDRLQEMSPKDALAIQFETVPPPASTERRDLTISWNDPRWDWIAEDWRL